MVSECAGAIKPFFILKVMMDRFTGFTRIISLMVITWEAKKSWKVILFSIMRKNLKKIEETQQKYSFKINNCEFLGNRNMSRCKCKILKFSNPLNSWYLKLKLSEAEFKEFEPRIKFMPRFKYGWFHLKLYQMFQDLSRRLI